SPQPRLRALCCPRRPLPDSGLRRPGCLFSASMNAQRTLRLVALNAALTAIYFAGGKLGLSLAPLHPSASPVWPPSGIALAAFLLLGHRVWPAILLGSFLVNLTTNGTPLTAIAIAIGNTLEGWLGAVFVTTFGRGVDAFRRPRTAMTAFFL